MDTNFEELKKLCDVKNAPESNNEICDAGEEQSEAKAYESTVIQHNLVSFTFGKTGQGITTEFLEIGKRLAQISSDKYIFLNNANIDPIADTYELVFELYDK